MTDDTSLPPNDDADDAGLPVPPDSSPTEDAEFDSAWADAQGADRAPEDALTPDPDPAPAPTPEPAPPAVEAAPDAEAGSDPEKIKQETRTWQGRRNKAKAEAEAEERRLEALRAEREALDRPGGDLAVADLELTDEERDALEAARTDYPTVDAAIRAHSKLQAKALLEKHVPTVAQQAAEPLVKPLRDAESARAQTETDRHWARIREAHADADDLRGDPTGLVEWMEGLPHREYLKYQGIYQTGTADQVIGMLSAYKQSQAEAEPPPTSKPPDLSQRRATQRVAGAAVPRHSGGIPKTGKADMNDFDAGWEEANASR